VFRIRIDLNTDPDPAFQVNTDPDSDPGFFMTKMIEKILFEEKKFFFQSQLAIKTLIDDFQAQDKTIRSLAKWSILFLS